MRLSIVGSWHQAFVLSACFADMGHDVTGIAEDARLLERLAAGRAPIHEPGLDALLEQNLASGRLRFRIWGKDSLQHADFVFLAIDTPVHSDDESDMSPIFQAADQIGRHASGPFVLCITAQVPVGTCARISDMVGESRPELRIPVVYVPEFLRLGAALETFREADRFVIGADDPEVASRVAALYEPLGRPIYRTKLNTAEMAKHASNAFLATSISFINEIADLCEETGSDVTEVGYIMKLDRRIGPHAFLDAGLGYAGGTLGREIQALRRLGESHHVDTSLLDSVQLVNSHRVERVMSRLQNIHGRLGGLRIAIWGLTYKAGTSTLRRSAALGLIERLQQAGALVAAFDPLARLDEVAELPPFDFCKQPLEAARGASALVLTAPWPEINSLDFKAVARSMKRPILIDTGNFLSPQRMAEAHFDYLGVGR